MKIKKKEIEYKLNLVNREIENRKIGDNLSRYNSGSLVHKKQMCLNL